MAKAKAIIEELAEVSGEDTILFPDLEKALVGITYRFGQRPLACYDMKKIISILMKDGMTKEEAWEYFSYNTLGAWVGDTTPCFINMDF